MKRILVDIILLGIILWVNPIAGFVLAIVFAFFQSSRFYEIIVFGVLIDVIYATAIEFGSLAVPLYTALGILLFLLLSRIQKQINFHV